MPRSKQFKRKNQHSSVDPRKLESARRFTLKSTPGHLIRKLHTRSEAIFERHARATNLTSRQVGVLLTLFQIGPMNKARLCEEVALDKSTMAEMTKRMTERGLIEAQLDPHDKRASTLSITDRGLEELATLVSQLEESQKEILEPLPSECRALFMTWLKILSD
jgi:DNA-binding MarR family transcriptional regulator